MHVEERFYETYELCAVGRSADLPTGLPVFFKLIGYGPERIDAPQIAPSSAPAKDGRF